MKNKKMLLVIIILLVVLCVGLIIFMTNVINGKFKFSNFNFFVKESDILVLDKTYDTHFKKTSASIRGNRKIGR